jgi:hypothetical protein
MAVQKQRRETTDGCQTRQAIPAIQKQHGAGIAPAPYNCHEVFDPVADQEVHRDAVAVAHQQERDGFIHPYSVVRLAPFSGPFLLVVFVGRSPRS